MPHSRRVPARSLNHVLRGLPGLFGLGWDTAFPAGSAWLGALSAADQEASTVREENPGPTESELVEQASIRRAPSAPACRSIMTAPIMISLMAFDHPFPKHLPHPCAAGVPPTGENS